jgi:hypothetical protein
MTTDERAGVLARIQTHRDLAKEAGPHTAFQHLAQAEHLLRERGLHLDRDLEGLHHALQADLYAAEQHRKAYLKETAPSTDDAMVHEIKARRRTVEIHETARGLDLSPEQVREIRETVERERRELRTRRT